MHNILLAGGVLVGCEGGVTNTAQILGPWVVSELPSQTVKETHQLKLGMRGLWGNTPSGNTGDTRWDERRS